MMCECSHDQLLHEECVGPCQRLRIQDPRPIGCGCQQFTPPPKAGDK